MVVFSVALSRHRVNGAKISDYGRRGVIENVLRQIQDAGLTEVELTEVLELLNFLCGVVAKETMKL